MKIRNSQHGGQSPAAGSTPLVNAILVAEAAAVDEADLKSAASRSEMSVIGADVVITGNLEASVDLYIEGTVIGDVRCSTLIISETGSVQGRVFASQVKIAGNVEGAVETASLAIESTAHVSGEVIYGRLKVANGGSLRGQITHRVADNSQQAGHEVSPFRALNQAL